MGSTTSHLLTIQSTDPSADVNVLLQLFPNQFKVETNNDDTSVAIVLCNTKDCLTLLIVPTTRLQLQPILTWTIPDSQIQKACAVDSVATTVYTVDQTNIAIVDLPGRTRIVMVPPSLTTTEKSRLQLATTLSEISSDNFESTRQELSSEKSTRIDEHSSTNNENNSPAKDSESINSISTPRPSPSLQRRQSDAISVQSTTSSKRYKRVIPTLRGTLQQSTTLTRIPFNSQQPIEFETEFFKGKLLFLVRPINPQDDPYWSERLFDHKKRNVIVQVQGKFKRQPTGSLYAGCEITSPKMKLGFITRGMLGALVKLIESKMGDVRCSFGDGEEYPRIVAPAHLFFESIVTTPADETPPEFTGLPFPEDAQHKKERLQAKTWDWNTSDTYSMSIYTMYVDFASWKVVNTPVVGNISLKTFWADAGMRIVMYEKFGSQKEHIQEKNSYGFSLTVHHVDTRGDGDMSESSDSVMSYVERNERYVSSDSDSFTSYHDDDAQTNDHDDEDDVFYDTTSTISQISGLSSRGSSIHSTLASIDSNVPACIDTIAKNGHHTKAYAVIIKSQFKLVTRDTCKDIIKASKMYHKVRRQVDSLFSHRLSSTEMLRRELGLLMLTDADAVSSLEASKSGLEKAFLCRVAPAIESVKGDTVLASGYVARAESDRHWVEEWCDLTVNRITFQHPEKDHHSVKINTRSILVVKDLEDNLPKIPGLVGLALETPGRTLYIAFNKTETKEQWKKVLSKVLMHNTDARSTHSEESVQYYEVDNPSEEFLHKSSMWECKHRRILNCGQFIFHTHAYETQEPDKLLEQTLTMVAQPSIETDSEVRRAFVNNTAALKSVNFDSLHTEESRAAFFLNLYHLMVLHAFLVLGPPKSSRKWLSFFTVIAYQVGDEIFSLSELEHNIIRASMSSPSQFVSRFIVPKSHYPRIKLNKPDYRYNFALNCGSESNPSKVIVYTGDQLNEQLDVASRIYLKNVTIKTKSAKDIQIVLPRICHWYTKDFGGSKQLVKKIYKYLSTRQQEQLTEHGGTSSIDTDIVSVKYDSYSFECNSFAVIPDLKSIT